MGYRSLQQPLRGSTEENHAGMGSPHRGCFKRLRDLTCFGLGKEGGNGWGGVLEKPSQFE